MNTNCVNHDPVIGLSKYQLRASTFPASQDQFSDNDCIGASCDAADTGWVSVLLQARPAPNGSA